MFPGDPEGTASEVVNCRCTLLQRARWALGEDELQTLKERAGYFGLDKSEGFEDFKKTYLHAVDKEEKSDIINSGAISGARNPYGIKAEKHAIKYYNSVRSMKTDIVHIAKTTGFSEKEIKEVKDFIFYDKHDLGGEVLERFEPDFMMAESWQRLINNTPEPHDITLINHEIMENKLMKQGYSQAEAHILATKKYNYDKEAKEFYDKIKKYKD